MGMRQLVDELISQGVLKTPQIIDAFLAIDRKDFLPVEVKEYAYINEPLSIGFGQTISQPWTVAFMLELLAPTQGQHILDVGSGSGWVTTLLSFIVSHDRFGKELPKNEWGKVIGLELLPELASYGIKNSARYNFIKRKIAEIHCLNAVEGFIKEAPYDRIIAAAAGRDVPRAWKAQLKKDGIMVLPIKDRIIRLIKKSESYFEEESHQGFAFVPFIETNDGE